MSGGGTNAVVSSARDWFREEVGCARGPGSVVLAVPVSAELVFATLTSAFLSSGPWLPPPCAASDRADGNDIHTLHTIMD